LNHACLYGQTKIVQYLIENGAEINAVTGLFGGMTPLIRGCTNCSLDVAKLLVSRGADPNLLTSGYNGENQLSPLFHAVSKGCYEVSEFLITQGADINFTKTGYKGKPGHTVLTLGIVSFADADIATMLINMGADVNKPGYGKYPIQYAIENFPIISNYDYDPEQHNKWADSFVGLIDLLLRKGAKKDVKTKDNQSLSDLVKNKFDVKYHSLKMEAFYRKKDRQISGLLEKANDGETPR
jgi:ankyrin repeat protein